jgi:hypothetical protein
LLLLGNASDCEVALPELRCGGAAIHSLPFLLMALSGTAIRVLQITWENPLKTHKNAKHELTHEPKNARAKRPHPWWPPRPPERHG